MAEGFTPKNVKWARVVAGERCSVPSSLFRSFAVEVKLLLLLLLSGQSVGVKGESGGRLIYTGPAPGPTVSFIVGSDLIRTWNALAHRVQEKAVGWILG